MVVAEENRIQSESDGKMNRIKQNLDPKEKVLLLTTSNQSQFTSTSGTKSQNRDHIYDPEKDSYNQRSVLKLPSTELIAIPEADAESVLEYSIDKKQKSKEPTEVHQDPKEPENVFITS